MKETNLTGLTSHNSNIHYNICIGENGCHNNAVQYSEGYSLAVQRLLDRIAVEPSKDLLIYPLFACYYQYVLLEINSLLVLSNSSANLLSKDLFQSWCNFKNNIEHRFDIDPQAIEKVDTIIKELSSFNPESFLYSKEFHENYELDRFNYINVEILKNQFYLLSEVFRDCRNSVINI